MDIVLLILAAIGHAAFWAGAVNRIHSTGLPRWLTKTCSTICHLCLIGILPALVVWLANDESSAGLVMARQGLGLFYLVPCWGVVIFHLPRWFHWRWTMRTPAILRSNHTAVIKITDPQGRAPLGNLFGSVLLRMPLNEALTLSIHEKVLEIPRLPPALDGLTIAHASDWHVTQRFDKSYYEALAHQTNELDADIVALTGDLFDDTRCFEWIGDTLAKLKSRHGTYFILGNHDLRTRDCEGLRKQLTDAGLIDLGGCWLRREIRGQEVVLAGNELPWIGPAADAENCPPRTSAGQLRIAMSHSPDQFEWARRFDFDLLLAGHTHGGQVRFPLIGAIYCPSRYGVQYALGTFYQPPTVMHVSRGVSSKLPIRWNCPPELTKIVLKSAGSAD